jgi:hypothetical protein
MKFIINFLPIIYVAAFAVSVSVAAYLVGNAKAQADPKKFLGAAIVAILFGFGIQALEAKRASSAQESAAETAGLMKLLVLTCQTAEKDGVAASERASPSSQSSAQLIATACKTSQAAQAKKSAADNPMLENLALLITLTCSTFAGALASVAITNRAKFQHDRETARINAELAGIATTEKWLKKEIGLHMHEQDTATRTNDQAGILLAKQSLDAAGRLRGKNLERKLELERELQQLQEKA